MNRIPLHEDERVNDDVAQQQKGKQRQTTVAAPSDRPAHSHRDDDTHRDQGKHKKIQPLNVVQCNVRRMAKTASGAVF